MNTYLIIFDNGILVIKKSENIIGAINAAVEEYKSVDYSQISQAIKLAV